MKSTVVLCMALSIVGCTSARSVIVSAVSDFEPKTPGAAPEILKPEYKNRDSNRNKIGVRLTLVASGLIGPTDFAPIPGEEGLAVVLGKNGDIYVVDLKNGGKKTVVKVKVATDSEQGLLGIAFHPDFVKNRRLFLNYTPTGTPSHNRVAEWVWPKGAALKEAPKEVKVLLDVEDPYPNHNGGQVLFGPDGYLYIGYGDGGWRDDPEKNGQNLKALLGKMVRIDVNSETNSHNEGPYGIPKDNPFVGKKFAKQRVRPEIWAYGLRNPWRYTFSTKGLLVVADVGQNAKEEVTYVAAGDNAGWSIFEGNNCHEEASGCPKKGKRFPITTYGRDDGISVTGGYEVLADTVPALKGMYVFADYAFGRIWAMRLPDDGGTVDRDQLTSLGQFPTTITSFGRDADGRVYVAAFSQGAIYRIDP